MSVLTINALNQFYGGSHTLWDVGLDVPAGSRTCLMGRNGMGKTTLLKCIMGLLPAASGEIRFDGHDLRAQPTRSAAAPRHRVRSAGPRDFSAADGGRESPDRPGGSSKRRAKGAAANLRSVSRAEDDAAAARRGSFRRQQQQLAIGRALVLEPSLLILDEPTEGIQPNIVHEIGDIILKLNKEMGLTVLLVEQKLPFARRVASEFRILEKGRCIAGGAISELTDNLVRAHLSV